MMYSTGFVIVFLLGSCSGRIIQNKDHSFSWNSPATEVKVEEEKYKMPSCNGDDFCDMPSYYPSKEILQIISNASAGLDNMFSHQMDTSDDVMEGMERGRNIFGRDDSVCKMFNFHIRPRIAKNTRGKFVFLVNAPDDDDETRFVQVVQTGQCMDTGQACTGAWPGYHRTECRQKYLEHKLVAVDTNLREVIVDTFKFPSCCTCHILSSFDL